MAKGDDIEKRTIDFAVQIINVVKKLPNDFTGKHLSNQLLRSGTSPAAHYAEARGAESKKDFIHKLKIGLKELNETKTWLKIIIGANLISHDSLKELLDECEQLSRIFNASIQTTRKSINN